MVHITSKPLFFSSAPAHQSYLADFVPFSEASASRSEHFEPCDCLRWIQREFPLHSAIAELYGAGEHLLSLGEIDRNSNKDGLDFDQNRP
jgi:hypothetical protein